MELKLQQAIEQRRITAIATPPRCQSVFCKGECWTILYAVKEEDVIYIGN
jgi:hypothetical protein